MDCRDIIPHRFLQLSCLLLIAIAAKPGEAVYGGKEVNIREYPHHASIEDKSGVKPAFICSGAILSINIIVTTASCFDKYYEPRDLLIRVGSPRFQSGGSTYVVTNKYTHPEYSPVTFANDVALLRVKSPIKWSQNVHSVELSPAFFKPSENETVYLSSWGTYEGGSLAPQLRHASLKRRICLSAGNTSSFPYKDQFLCASNYPYMGTCTRDQGAPLIVSKGFLVGLASRRGFGCKTRLASIFFRLDSREIRSFILAYLRM